MTKKRKTPEEVTAHFRAEAAIRFPDSVVDDEARAAFWVGHYQWFDYTCETALQIFLRQRPRTGSSHRMMGEVKDGVLWTWRADGNRSHLHKHPRLHCYTIAFYPIAHAAEFGFHAVSLNDRPGLITVEELLQMPEVPKSMRGGYERAIQLPKTGKEEE
jgi:hypothetical protein